MTEVLLLILWTSAVCLFAALMAAVDQFLKETKEL